MCGIAGILDPAGVFGAQALADIARRMAQSLAHRGPDDEGVWLSPGGHCALAHRRLSVIDITDRGHQPMVETDGNHAACFNGEIYNFRQLRRELESTGQPFHSDSDTEVLLRLFRDAAPDALKRLEGMYAFAVWNETERRLLLARDAFGKKPLYIARGNHLGGEWMAFASELGAFHAIPGFEASISEPALRQLLMLQYIHAPLTVYEGVEKLLPGHWLSVTLRKDGGLDSHGGAHFHFKAGRGRSPSAVEHQTVSAKTLDKAADTLLPLLVEATERRMIADVPLGAFLSGGIDSALIVAIIRRELGRPLSTFSIGFQGSVESEHEMARQAATILGTDHHERILSPDIVEFMPRIAAALDEPLGDTSCLPTYLLSEFTRGELTVALSGDGGDELFGGYGRYGQTLLESASPWVRFRYLLRHRRAWRPELAYFDPRTLMSGPARVTDMAGHRDPDENQLLLEHWRSHMADDGRPLMDRMRELDVQSYLPGAVLAKVDRMSMAHALEVRCPFLDRDVAAFAQTLEPGLLHSGGMGKPLLRHWAARYLPEDYIKAPKRGFGVPGMAWAREPLLRLCDEVLLVPDGRLANRWGTAGLRRFVDGYRHPRRFLVYPVWNLLMLELWLREHAGD